MTHDELFLWLALGSWRNPLELSLPPEQHLPNVSLTTCMSHAYTQSQLLAKEMGFPETSRCLLELP